MLFILYLLSFTLDVLQSGAINYYRRIALIKLHVQSMTLVISIWSLWPLSQEVLSFSHTAFYSLSLVCLVFLRACSENFLSWDYYARIVCNFCFICWRNALPQKSKAAFDDPQYPNLLVCVRLFAINEFPWALRLPAETSVQSKLIWMH